MHLHENAKTYLVSILGVARGVASGGLVTHGCFSTAAAV